MKNKFKNVKFYGAVGDGIVDDRAAIQAAIDDDGSDVVFPPGTYNVDGPLNVTGAKEDTWTGDGAVLRLFASDKYSEFINCDFQEVKLKVEGDTLIIPALTLEDESR